MAYNEKLADRIREQLVGLKVEEKRMMGGLTFMVNAKMCVGVLDDDLMVRLAPEVYTEALEKPGCRAMDFTGRPMKGFVFVSPEGTKGLKQLTYWIGLALDFNRRAKASRKKKSKKS
jgi:TfoX/Sxy family transcriptional regulator of competence genes